MNIITKISLFVLMIISGLQVVCAQDPTVPAPKPTRADADVKSIYSDHYNAFNDVKMTTMAWGQKCVPVFVKLFGTDNMLKIEGFDWAPLRLTPLIDISDMDSIHVDVFLSLPGSRFNMGLMTYNISGLPEVTKYSTFIASYLTNPTGEWISYDLSLNEFKDQGQDCQNINVLRLRGAWTVYVDNIYAYKGTKTGVSEIKTDDSFKIYPTVVSGNVSFESAENIKKICLYNTTGQVVMVYNLNCGKSSIDLSSLSSGSYIVSAQLVSGKTLTKRILKL